ncbi:MAG TPA: efflux RND transporter periplasmic adaptor subunit [Patescibacteria group bacterium]|nr:efflux RND transporter periplasmic adaptor subunit [Patescibacteria group bacterium]
MKSIVKFFIRIVQWFFRLSFFKKIAFFALFIGLLWLIFSRISALKNKQTQYQTTQAEKGTLIISVPATGTVAATNSISVTTQATGVVSKLYAKDGDEVISGQKIAEIDLDMIARQKNAQTLSSYQSAKNTQEAAKANLYTTQSDMFDNWKTFYTLATNSTYQNADGSANETNRTLPEFHIAQNNWLAGEAKYKNQQSVVVQTQTALNAAWLAYQQTSSTIYALISGKVTGLSLQEGSVITPSTNTENTAQSSTHIAYIKTKAQPLVSINLTEIDVPKVKIGNPATITFDAFSDKTFTGRVISIDTVGESSTGVTIYPVFIRLDLGDDAILPHMATFVHIITQTKDNVLLVPSSALQSRNGESIVRVMKNEKITETAVKIGLASDTQTEILSGLSEGDMIVTLTVQEQISSRNQTQSPFGGFGTGGLRPGGFNIRTR